MPTEPVIVIGTGPAGAAAALFLRDAGVDVLLVEAGSARSAFGLTVRVGGMTVAKYRRPLHVRANVRSTADPNALLYEDLSPGGLTNHWSCAVPRFSAEDFTDAERAGEAYQWPLTYDDLAPWYDRVEPLLNIAGGTVSRTQLPAGKVRRVWQLGAAWENVEREAARFGRSITPMPYAYGSDTTVTLSGTVFNSFVRLIRPVLNQGWLSVRHDSRAVSLEWSPRARRVEAVTVRHPRTGRTERLACRAVVVAAGAVNSAQLLLSSRSADFPHGLGNTHDVLGRYLHDHPLGKLVIDLDEPVLVHPPSYFTRVSLERSRPLYAAACMQWGGAANLAGSVLKGRPGQLPWIGFSVFGTMAPDSQNWVALDERNRNVQGDPALELHVSHPPEAHAVLEEAREHVLETLSAAGWHPRQRVWKVEAVGESKHFAGTCRMHASPKFGMLDAWSRLHAVPNVVVADSAAFTTGPEKNPVLTAMALAARASDRLSRELSSGNL